MIHSRVVTPLAIEDIKSTIPDMQSINSKAPEGDSVSTQNEDTSIILLSQSQQEASVVSMAAAQNPVDSTAVPSEPINPTPSSLDTILEGLDPHLQEKVLRNLRASGAAKDEAKGKAYTPLSSWLAERDEACITERQHQQAQLVMYVLSDKEVSIEDPFQEQANFGTLEAEQLQGALVDNTKKNTVIDRPAASIGTFETSEILDGTESFVMIESNPSSLHNAIATFDTAIE